MMVKASPGRWRIIIDDTTPLYAKKQPGFCEWKSSSKHVNSCIYVGFVRVNTCLSGREGAYLEVDAQMCPGSRDSLSAVLQYIYAQVRQRLMSICSGY
ncbi:MAG: hypothetical protein JW936_04815 [Sedimentisphaerales bacterium]|nr:hypothetical protein [Sedimentisphaerales bacterium]